MTAFTRRQFIQSCVLVGAAGAHSLEGAADALGREHRRLVVVGASSWSIRTAAALAARQAAGVQAWVEPNRFRWAAIRTGSWMRRLLATEPAPSIFPTWTAAADHPSATTGELAIVGAPPHRRAELSRQLLRTGLDVLVRPPVAMNPGELEQLVRVLRSHPARRLLVAQPHRADAALGSWREALRHGHAAPVDDIRIRIREPLPTIGHTPKWRGGGQHAWLGEADRAALSPVPLSPRALDCLYYDAAGFSALGHGCWNGPAWSALDLAVWATGFDSTAQAHSTGVSLRREPALRALRHNPDQEVVVISPSGGPRLTLDYRRHREETRVSGLMSLHAADRACTFCYDPDQGWQPTGRSREARSEDPHAPLFAIDLRDCLNTHRIALSAVCARAG